MYELECIIFHFIIIRKFNRVYVSYDVKLREFRLFIVTLHNISLFFSVGNLPFVMTCCARAHSVRTNYPQQVHGRTPHELEHTHRFTMLTQKKTLHDAFSGGGLVVLECNDLFHRGAWRTRGF